jgi:hypothetical protein
MRMTETPAMPMTKRDLLALIGKTPYEALRERL